jgi:prepilin-type N-terminal cleavage/methylation domain-containing protein
MRALRHSGFTLIELLVTMAVIAVLAGMLMPMIGSAQRGAKRTNTQNLLRKVEVALAGFKGDVGHYPWQERPDAMSTPGSAWSNGLAFRLHHSMGPAELDALSADRAAVPPVFNGGSQDWTAGSGVLVNQPGTTATGVAADQLIRNRIGQAMALNRMSIERALVGIMSGNTGIAGVAYGSSWGPGAPILANPRSLGFSDDYLGSDIQDKEFTSRTVTVGGSGIDVPYDIVDAYQRTPLIYLHSLVNGVKGGFPYPFYESNQLRGTFPRIDAGFYALTPGSRSVTTARASDVRDTAPRAYVGEFELWSCGPDRSFAAQRDDHANADNVAAQNYWAGLDP